MKDVEEARIHVSVVGIPILFLFFIVCLLGLPSFSETPLQILTKAPNLSDGWARTGQPELFDKESVFKLIDGEAEGYFPYGFKQVAAVSYVKNGNPATLVAVEVYEMGSLLDAFGIYSSNREPDSKIIAIGAEGFGNESQIMFYQDRYFLKLRADKPEGGKELLHCAQAIAKVLGGATKPPKELGLIQIQGLVPQTEQYIGQSLLGYAFWPKGFTADAKDGAVSARIFVVMFPSPEAAGKSIAVYADYLKKENQELKSIENGGRKLWMTHDPLHQGLVIEQAGPYIIGAAKLPQPEQGIVFLNRLRPLAK